MHGTASDTSCSLGGQLLGHSVMWPIQWKGWSCSQFISHLPEAPCNQKRGNEKGDKTEHLEMRSVTVAKFWPWHRNKYNSLPCGIDSGMAETQRLLPWCIVLANQTNSAVSLSQDDIGVGRSPCTEPAHDARSRLVKCEACITGVSEAEPGAKFNALAANDGGARIVGKEGINCMLFCSVVSPKATSRGRSTAVAAAGALTGAGSRMVPMDATDIDGATPVSGIDGVTAGIVAVAAKGACCKGGVR